MNFFKNTALLTSLLSIVALGDEVANTTAANASILSVYKVEKFGHLVTAPSFSLGAPVGMVPGYGVIFAGLSGKTNSSDTDGALAVGMGFGDPLNSLGGAA
ncbi:MAG: hypothetical protein RR421_02300, partial [Cetobacterium sp.]